MQLDHSSSLIVLICYMLFLCSSTLVLAQEQNPVTFSSSGTTSVSYLAANDTITYIAGRFRSDFQLPDTTLISKGEEDLFLIAQNQYNEQELIWAGGSMLDEDWGGFSLTLEADGIYMGGSYWQELTFRDTILQAEGNPKALFLARTDLSGQIEWATSIPGGGLKELSGLTVLPNGDVIIAGFFSDSLILDSDTLFTDAEVSSMMICYTETGQLKWVESIGGTGQVQLKAITSSDNGDIYVTGWYDNQLTLADTIIFSNTSDRDVFIARYSLSGQPIWLEKAGGVFDEEPTAIAVDKMGYPVIVGFLVGRMTINGQINIESADGNADGFILRYQPTGKLAWARILTGDQLQAVTTLTTGRNGIFLAGEFQENVSINEKKLEAEGLYDTFIAHLDDFGNTLWFESFSSKNLLLPTTIALSSSNTALWMGGSFKGELPWAETPVFQGQFSGYGVQLFSNTTETSSLNFAGENNITVFPDPASGKLYFSGLRPSTPVIIMNAYGRIVWQGVPQANALTLPTHLASGKYGAIILQNTQRTYLPFLLIR